MTGPRLPMRRIARIAACCLIVAAAGSVQAEQPLSEPKPLGPGGKAEPPPLPAKERVVRIDWRTDLEAAQKEAAASGRIVLIFFHADWCQPCKWMDGGTFANRAVAEYVRQNFIPVKVDDTKETSAITKKYLVRLYPTVLFLASSGEPLSIMLGPRPPGDFYPVLERVQALPKLIEAAKKSPDDADANFAAADALANLDQLKRAEPYLKRAAELDPKDAHGHLHQSRLLLALVPLEDGDVGQALKNLGAFLDEFKDAPEVPTAMFVIGNVLYKDGKLQDARQVYERLRTAFPTHLKAYEADKAIDLIDARLKAQAGQDKQSKNPAPAPKQAVPAKAGP